MRKLIFATNLTADGCCDHAKGTGSDELHEYFTDLLREAGLLVYGRKTYQLMVPFWPDVARSQSMSKISNEFARVFASIPIAVFSRTLDTAEGNARIVRGNLRDEILKWKQEPGKDILAGGVELPRQLVELGLVDEFRIVIHPVIVGEGRRLFDDLRLQERVPLRLLNSQVLSSGSVALHYAKQ